MNEEEQFIVICTERGVYHLTTREVFASRAEAEAYALTVNESRKPLVIAGRFRQLRFPTRPEPSDPSPLVELAEKLNQAQLVVSRVAQELSDGAAPHPYVLTQALVNADDMQELRDALKAWKQATEAFLKHVHDAAAEGGDS